MDRKTIASSLGFITENVDKIQGEIQNSNFLKQANSLNFAKYSELYGLMNTCINTYFDATTALLNELNSEMGAITSYAVSMQDLDSDLEKSVGDQK